MMGRTTQPARRKGPCFIDARQGSGGTLVSAERSARSVSHTEGVDKVRALQRVLYRSAKQHPQRRFHALYDKVARSDILWRAWVDVAINGGAPGVDGVSIDAIRDGGVEGVRAFLDGLAAELREKRYRPQPLRRVHIPKPGKPGQTRPLGIPAIRRIGDHGGSEDRLGASLRGGLRAGQFRVPTEALGSRRPQGDPSRGQPGPSVGALGPTPTSKPASTTSITTP